MTKVTRLSGGQRTERRGQSLHLREIPLVPDMPLESVGQDLRAARLRRGDELGQISQALHIRKDYLEAIEADLADKLPGRTYAIGFVRSYANYLGLDAPSLTSRYKLAAAGQVETAPMVGPPPETGGRAPVFGWLVAALVVAGLLVFGVYQLSQPPLPAEEMPSRSAETTKASLATSPHQTPASPKNLVQPTVAAGTQAAETADGRATPASVATGQVFGVQNRDARVVLRARGLTHVLVQGSNGRVYLNRLLHLGDVYRVPNMVGLSLTTPDGGAVSLELDGQERGMAGTSGHVTEALSLDPQAIVERKGPRSAQSNKVTP